MISNVIRIKLDELLEARGKSLYAVAKETGVAYNALSKIKKNDVRSISFDVMEKLCISLDCKPNDLFEIESS
jgi:putative transcriptional regulator